MLTTPTRTLVACLLAFLVSTGLVGCGVLTALRPTASVAPLRHFESDQKAQEAAMELLPKYYAALDAVTMDGGMRPDRVYPYVTPNYRSNLNLAFEKMRNDHLKTTGLTAITRNLLIDYAEKNAGEAFVVVRLCLDLSHTRVLGAADDDETPTTRLDHTAYDVSLTTSDGDANRLYVASTRARRDLGPC